MYWWHYTKTLKVCVTNCPYYDSIVNACSYLWTQISCNLVYEVYHPFVIGILECWTSCHVTCTAFMGILRYFSVNKLKIEQIMKLNECRRYVSRTLVVMITQMEWLGAAYIHMRLLESTAKTNWTVRNVLIADNMIG